MIEEDYDIDLPDVTYEQKQIIKEKKEEVRGIQKDLRQQLRQTNWLTRFRFFRYVRKDLRS
jgi:O-methyltransferase involved in polyketide biosynthesis